MFFKSRKSEIPAMTLEGVLGPNTFIDDAEGMAIALPRALCLHADGRLLIASSNAVLALSAWGKQPETWAEFAMPVTALCASPGGQVAIGLADGTITVRDMAGAVLDGWGRPETIASAVDALFLAGEKIAVVDNGYRVDEDILSLATWDEKPRGQVVAISRDGSTRRLSGALHCPMGVARDAKGELVVSLFERASVVDLSGTIRQSGFPAYLGRIRNSADGYLISCLSRRDPLIEFFKTEKEFVAEMKEKIDPRHWMSPRANPEFSHEYPIELGATRLFGEIKPWAPSFSYGLVIETGADFIPTGSAHSRADGGRHAISDAIRWDGAVVAISQSSGELLRFSFEREAA